VLPFFINFELLSALIGFSVGLWLFLGSLLAGRNPRSGRRAAIAVLGLVFLADAALSLYVLHENTSYFLHKHLCKMVAQRNRSSDNHHRGSAQQEKAE